MSMSKETTDHTDYLERPSRNQNMNWNHEKHEKPRAVKPQPKHKLEPRKARKVRKNNILESTEHTE